MSYKLKMVVLFAKCLSITPLTKYNNRKKEPRQRKENKAIIEWDIELYEMLSLASAY